MTARRYGPAPDPPTRGFWIDPEDPTRIRYHSGKRWANRSYSREIWEREQPKRQGLFLLGAGKEGIATGIPLAGAEGRYLGRFGIWLGVLAICAGFTGLWVGMNHDVPALGWSGFAVIVTMFSFFAVTAWRAGLRPPGWGLVPGDRTLRPWFIGWMSLISGAALGSWIAPSLPRESIAYDWCNRVGMILLNGAVLAAGSSMVYGVVKEWNRPDVRRWVLMLFLVVGVALPAWFLWGTWERVQDALWLK